jgi:hypothetical protein
VLHEEAMAHRSIWAILLTAVLFGSLGAGARADSEADLLQKFQKQNQSAADKLRQEATRLLKAKAPSDAEPLRKVLAQLQDDRQLPSGERSALVRQLQERLRLCARSEPKLRVSPSAFVGIDGATVNVPDGGVRVLGGAGFRSEGRNEGGVPVLGKVPYLGRGFRNVGAGSSTTSVQTSVSVRIIILEEESEKLLRGQK